jgi:hypothetical protein
MIECARRIAVVSVALLLSCCTNERETKALLGIVSPNVAATPSTSDERNDFSCQQYGFYPGSKEFDDCMKYVGSRRSNSPSPPPR